MAVEGKLVAQPVGRAGMILLGLTRRIIPGSFLQEMVETGTMESRNRAIPDDSTARDTMHELLHPTPYADVNAVLHEFLRSIQTILGKHLRGMYLSGSLALGDFDPRSSDLDLVVVTGDALSYELFVALREMHARFDTSGSPWAAKVDAV